MTPPEIDDFEIEEKVDSPAKLADTIGKPTNLYLFATEFNSIKTYLLMLKGKIIDGFNSINLQTVTSGEGNNITTEEIVSYKNTPGNPPSYAKLIPSGSLEAFENDGLSRINISPIAIQHSQYGQLNWPIKDPSIPHRLATTDDIDTATNIDNVLNNGSTSVNKQQNFIGDSGNVVNISNDEIDINDSNGQGTQFRPYLIHAQNYDPDTAETWGFDLSETEVSSWRNESNWVGAIKKIALRFNEIVSAYYDNSIGDHGAIVTNHFQFPRLEDGASKQVAITDDVNNAILNLVDGADPSANTLQKLYAVIKAHIPEDYVPNIAARDAYNITHLPFSLFVIDDGDGKWAKYQATTIGVGATFVKLSDPDLLNAAMSASAIKASYESNTDTNAFTNALLTKLNGITSGATANSTDAYLLNRNNHTGTQLAATISDFASALLAITNPLYNKVIGKTNTGTVTGSTSATLLSYIKIPANTLADGSDFDAKSWTFKTGSSGTYQVRFALNTTPSIIGSTILGYYTTGASTALFVPFKRTFALLAGNLYFINNSLSFLTDDIQIQGTSYSQAAFNPAIDQYIIVQITLTNSTDSVTNSLFKIIGK